MFTFSLCHYTRPTGRQYSLYGFCIVRPPSCSVTQTCRQALKIKFELPSEVPSAPVKFQLNLRGSSFWVYYTVDFHYYIV